MDIENYREKVMGCWLGKAVGGTLGMPFEGMNGPFDLTFYDPVPTEMIPNDDLDLQVVWAYLLDQQEKPVVSRHLFEKAWLENIQFPWDEYGVCIRNLREGIKPPLSGSHDNWFSNGMGAVIRSEIWACLAPGNPKLAAAYAYEDACLDHTGQGLWVEVWLAAMQSAAFVETDIDKIVKIGFEHIPAGSDIHAAVQDTYDWWNELKDWRRVRLLILEKYGHENFTNVTENMAFTLLALLDGAGDFSRSICTATNCGKDTDCTAATVGALLGIMNPDCIDEKWLLPIGRDLVLSPPIKGIEAPDSLDGFTDLILNLRERLDGAFPEPGETAELSPDAGIPARIGFGKIGWFGQGWPLSKPLELELPAMKSIRFPGTYVSFESDWIEGGAIFVEYTFKLERETPVRVFFNTPENCRVFLNGSFAFGRECGRMAPSAHRVPINQSVDTKLAAGNHTLIAVMENSEQPRRMEWVAGVADLEDHLQWIPKVFVAGE